MLLLIILGFYVGLIVCTLLYLKKLGAIKRAIKKRGLVKKRTTHRKNKI